MRVYHEPRLVINPIWQMRSKNVNEQNILTAKFKKRISIYNKKVK